MLGPFRPWTKKEESMPGTILIGRRDGIQNATWNFGLRQGANEGGYACGL
jgi:hypothetical protein